MKCKSIPYITMRLSHSFYYFAIPTVFLALLAYFAQTKMFLSPDVGYLLHASQQVLAGAHYGADIFETNPPMILYLYAPAWFLVKLLSVNIILAVRSYVLVLSLVSLTANFVLLKKILKPEDTILFFVLFYTLVFSMLFLPTYSFGQREHMLFILMMPYVLSAAARLENQLIDPRFGFFIGLLAGLGFALKPFFLVLPCLVELLFIFKKRRLFAWVRVETITIMAVLTTYFSVILIFQPDYLKIVLPMVLKFYFISSRQSFDLIFSNCLVIFCLLGVVAYFIFSKQDQYRTLSTVIWLALIGMIAAFLIPRSAWFYHHLPALCLTCLLIANYIGQIVTYCREKRSGLATSVQDVVVVSVALVFIFIIPLTGVVELVQYAMKTYVYSESRIKLQSYLNSRVGERSIFCFSSKSDSDCFPLIYLTNSEYGSRFPFFWWYLGVKKMEEQRPAPKLAAQIAENKKFLIESVADDLNKFKARWVIIDTSQQAGDVDFKMLTCFAENQKFHEAWRHYKYAAIIDNYWVFERKS